MSVSGHQLASPQSARMGFMHAQSWLHAEGEDESRPQRARHPNEDEHAERIREHIKDTIEKLQNGLKAQQDQLKASPNAEEADDGIAQLEAIIQSLETQKSFVSLATPTMLYGMQSSMMAANLKGKTATDASIGMTQGLNAISSHMVDFYATEMESHWSEKLKQETKEFGNRVAQQGFVGALLDPKTDYRYDHVGPVHAHMMKNDPIYRAKTAELEARADARNKASEAGMGRVDAIAKGAGIAVDHGHIDQLKAEVEAAKKNGEILTQHDKEAELEGARLQAMQKAREQAQQQGKTDAAAAIAKEETEQKKRYEDAMRARDEQFKAHTEALQREAIKQGKDKDPAFQNKLNELKQHHEQETQRISGMAHSKDSMAVAINGALDSFSNLTDQKKLHVSPPPSRIGTASDPKGPTLSTAATDSEGFGEPAAAPSSPAQSPASPAETKTATTDAIKEAGKTLKDAGAKQETASKDDAPKEPTNTPNTKTAEAKTDKGNART